MLIIDSSTHRIIESSNYRIFSSVIPCNANQTQAAKSEISRAIVGRGTVVRHMRDGSTQMLFATGKFSGGKLRRTIAPLHTVIDVVRGEQVWSEELVWFWYDVIVGCFPRCS